MNVAIVSGCVIESIGMTNTEWQMQRKANEKNSRGRNQKKIIEFQTGLLWNLIVG